MLFLSRYLYSYIWTDYRSILSLYRNCKKKELKKIQFSLRYGRNRFRTSQAGSRFCSIFRTFAFSALQQTLYTRLVPFSMHIIALLCLGCMQTHHITLSLLQNKRYDGSKVDCCQNFSNDLRHGQTMTKDAKTPISPQLVQYSIIQGKFYTIREPQTCTFS